MEELYCANDASLKTNNDKLFSKSNTGKKSKKCIQCEYESTDTANLRRHIKTHSGKKLHKCNQGSVILHFLNQTA